MKRHNPILRRPLMRAVIVEQARSLPSCRVSEQESSILLHSKSPGEFLSCRSSIEFCADNLCEQLSLNKQEAFHRAGSQNKLTQPFYTQNHPENFSLFLVNLIFAVVVVMFDVLKACRIARRVIIKPKPVRLRFAFIEE